jgi:hypothetical protein
MITIKATSISGAWLGAIDAVLGAGGSASNVIVAIEPGAHGAHREITAVRELFDRFLATHASKGVRRIRKVADTIFPTDFYRGGPGQDAREHLYRMQRRASRIERRFIWRGTYFDRLIDWPGGNGTESDLDRNQLERAVRRLQKAKRNQSANELALSSSLPEEVENSSESSGDLRVQDPSQDKNPRGFPCLSHVSLTLHDGRLALTALYRNQFFLTKAYGNFLGLADLQQFIAAEAGCAVGEMVCIATHADAEVHSSGISRAAITNLVEHCRAAMDCRGTGIVELSEGETWTKTNLSRIAL